MLENYVRVDAPHKDNCDAAKIEIMKLQAHGKVVLPTVRSTDKYPRKGPFIVIIQDDSMKTLAQRIFGLQLLDLRLYI